MTKKAVQTDQEHLDRILAWYDQASEDERATGHLWYSLAYDKAKDIADRHRLSPTGVAGAVAALSPLREWERNLQDAETLSQVVAEGGEVPIIHFAMHLERALACLQGAEPMDVLSGPKVRAFYSAIMGDEEAVTIDRWAMLAAHGVPVKQTPSTYGYLCLQETYRQAAKKAGAAPAALQATVWTAVRNAVRGG